MPLGSHRLRLSRSVPGVTCHQLGFDAETGGIRLLELADRYHYITDIDVHCSITS